MSADAMNIEPGLGFLVIGAMKSGTTTLHRYLSKHPQLALPAGKEAPFFFRDDYYERGLDWYIHEFFPAQSHAKLMGTVSPQYMAYPECLMRIRDACPDIKLIALLRNPLIRAVSHYSMAVRMSGECRTFQDAIISQLKERDMEYARHNPSPTNSYVTWGEYGRILSRYTEEFGISNLLVTFTRDLQSNPRDTLRSVTSFLGVQELVVNTYQEMANVSTGNGIHARVLAKLVSMPGIRTLLRFLLRERRASAIRSWSAMNRSSGQSYSTDLAPDIRRNLALHYCYDSKVLQTISSAPLPWMDELEAAIQSGDV